MLFRSGATKSAAVDEVKALGVIGPLSPTLIFRALQLLTRLADSSALRPDCSLRTRKTGVRTIAGHPRSPGTRVLIKEKNRAATPGSQKLLREPEVEIQTATTA